jgi:hypothetical protein
MRSSCWRIGASSGPDNSIYRQLLEPVVICSQPIGLARQADLGAKTVEGVGTASDRTNRSENAGSGVPRKRLCRMELV